MKREENNKLITIVVPVYNVEEYIHECVDSILNQTYTNIELILSDDGSTDNSGKICDEYRKQDNRVKVIHEINEGLSAARNRGIEIARGEYIIFVDSDDYIKMTCIEYLISLILKYEAEMAMCPFLRDYAGTITQTKRANKELCLDVEGAFDLIFTERMYVGIYACNKLFKKSLFQTIRFPVGKYFEDSGTTYKLIAKCNKIAYGSIPQYYYRFGREDSIVKASLKKQERYLDKLFFLNEMELFFKKHNQIFSRFFYNFYLGDLMLIISKISPEANKNLHDVIKNAIDTRIKFVGEYRFSFNVKIKIMIYRTNYKLYRLIFR